jgi:serine O-acetyltransferase
MAKTKVGRPGRPVIGNRVRIGPGAVFVGGVEVGDDAMIGPNAVVFAEVVANRDPAEDPEGAARRRIERDFADS